LEICRVIEVAESEQDGKPTLRLLALLDGGTAITLDSYDLEKTPRAEASREIELVRDQVFRAISNGARFFKIE